MSTNCAWKGEVLLVRLFLKRGNTFFAVDALPSGFTPVIFFTHQPIALKAYQQFIKETHVTYQNLDIYDKKNKFQTFLDELKENYGWRFFFYLKNFPLFLGSLCAFLFGGFITFCSLGQECAVSFNQRIDGYKNDFAAAEKALKNYVQFLRDYATKIKTVRLPCPRVEFCRHSIESLRLT